MSLGRAVNWDCWFPVGASRLSGLLLRFGVWKLALLWEGSCQLRMRFCVYIRGQPTPYLISQDLLVGRRASSKSALNRHSGGVIEGRRREGQRGVQPWQR